MTRSVAKSKAVAAPSRTSTQVVRNTAGQTYDEWAAGLHETGQAALGWFQEATANRPPIPQYRVSSGGEISPDHPAGLDGAGRREFEARLCQALGTISIGFANTVTNELSTGPGLSGATVSTEDRTRALNRGLGFIAANEPTSENETLILLQIWQTHGAQATQLRKMAQTEGLLQLEAHGSMATKLGNLQIRQLETLLKIKSAGRQVIEVQHIHVYPGGNAVVGTVNTGGGAPAIERLPHAPAARLGDAVGATLRSICADDRQGVPSPSDPKPCQMPHALGPRRRR